MSNYAFIQKIEPPLTKTSFFRQVALAGWNILGDGWKVAWADFDYDGPTLLVTIPETAKVTQGYWGEGSPFEDIGFVVSLQDAHTIAFRHSPMPEFARWAQGCIEEELSERLNAPLHYDAGPTTYTPGHREYRRGRSFREYLLRDFEGKEREEWQKSEFFRRLILSAPPGFDT